MTEYALLGISGSLRKDSFNTKLIREAARLGEATTFTEGDLNLPLFDEDLEAEKGIPAAVQTLSDKIAAADAVVISSPEYNKGIPGVLKNALDWVSRTDGNPWQDKPLAIMSATAGRAGGERTQFDLRLKMVPFQPNILQGPEVLVGGASNHFDEDGQLITDSYIDFLTKLMDKLKREIK
ncbi:NADPH-dependent FMN reductase [Litoreibacter roseus]|uniref:NAD(P)H-dependent FMN reductase n=1 Tax=Litoreibacter roseus TaxID=2601869 RepID=A0A6N6JIG6_9RHOB|nr:NAD(P)H-dependent oxidoreductase [Litoreibacter roseus]GFE64992.1 NAD(P)H-dependent FMN reductase [Litoreibacter roseus]